ncbi:MAG: trigger factor family protein [Candidatus Shapirobacteria bacterium]|jgi:FKBP-type peptidyl-prolyl cis-trans isomerase (trigger factor)
MMSAPLKLKLDPDQKFTLTGEIKAEDVRSAYQKNLVHHQQHLKLDGFRPGKVPLNLVTQNTDPQELLEETINESVSQIYQLSLDHHQLKPIIPPQVSFLSTKFELDKDWPLEITSCLVPKIELKPTLYSLIAKLDSKLELKAKTEKVISLLEKSTKITVPQILLDYEFSRQKPDSKKPTPQDKAEFEAKLTNEWAVNLAINQIATNEKISVSPEEMKAVISQNPSLSQNPNLVYYLLLQQKAIDFLLAKIS